MPNKKGVFNLLLVFVAIGILIYAYIIFEGLVPEKGNIGQKQKEILRTYYQSERDLSYIDKSAEYSLNSALWQLNDKGGYVIMQKGHAYNNYFLWQTKSSNYMPTYETLYKNIQSLAGKELEKYISDYELKEFPANNYDYFIYLDDNKLHLAGIALKNLVYEDKSIKYSIKPSFNIFLNYNVFQHYASIINNITSEKGLINSAIGCENKKNNLTECILSAIKKINKSSDYEWILDCDKSTKQSENEKSRIYPICVRSNIERIISFSDKITAGNPMIKFALYIKDIPPAPIKELNAVAAAGKEYSVILSWKQADESDISHYNIYYSPEFDLRDKEINNATINEKQKEASRISIELENIIESLFPITGCTFKGLGKECFPDLDTKKLYQIKGGYLYIRLDSLKNRTYSIAVTGVDKAGNEINKIQSSIEITPKDSLAPGRIQSLNYDKESYKITILPPNKNIDGSELKDDLIYYYFLKEGSCGDKTIEFNEKLEITDSRITEEGINAKAQAQQNDYCILAFAADQNNNPVEIIRENKISKLRIKPEYEEIFPELYVKTEIKAEQQTI
ncbi:hypothetical protein GF323_01295 [Candidatus Woesearchaeota archaeon]|nr:hypothetical protein [Candidatus Woesearchaeota archaeon]